MELKKFIKDFVNFRLVEEGFDGTAELYKMYRRRPNLSPDGHNMPVRKKGDKRLQEDLNYLLMQGSDRGSDSS